MCVLCVGVPNLTFVSFGTIIILLFILIVNTFGTIFLTLFLVLAICKGGRKRGLHPASLSVWHCKPFSFAGGYIFLPVCIIAAVVACEVRSVVVIPRCDYWQVMREGHHAPSLQGSSLVPFTAARRLWCRFNSGKQGKRSTFCILASNANLLTLRLLGLRSQTLHRFAWLCPWPSLHFFG